MDPENTGLGSIIQIVLTDTVKPFLSRAVVDLLDRLMPAAQEECFRELPNRRPQLNRMELNRVERDQRLD